MKEEILIGWGRSSKSQTLKMGKDFGSLRACVPELYCNSPHQG